MLPLSVLLRGLIFLVPTEQLAELPKGDYYLYLVAEALRSIHG